MKRYRIVFFLAFVAFLFGGCNELFEDLLKDELENSGLQTNHSENQNGNNWWTDEDEEVGDQTEDQYDQTEDQYDQTEDQYDDEVSDSVKSSEAYKAFLYLNEIRANPGAYSNECNVDLSSISPRPALVWNDTLAKVAAEKAQDMVDRNYFDHIDPDGYGMNIKMAEAGYELRQDWYSDPSSNFFESISAGTEDGVDGIRNLIEDEGVNPPGHRNHLLGLDDFWSDCTDIGIGYVYSDYSDYPSYMCVLIAKHDF